MALGHLTFRARHAADSAVDGPGRVTLRGELEWFVSGPADELSALESVVGPTFAERASETTLLLRFGNAVGKFAVPSVGTLEVRCGKWSEETFDSMLEDLTRVALGLPFSATQAAGLPHDRALADRDDVLLHAFLYARHIVLTTAKADALGPALEAVLADPHRRFVSERQRVDLQHARRVDARTLYGIATGAEPLEEAPPALHAMPLARALGGRIPRVIDEPRVLHSVDTPENRFVLGLLEQVVALVDRVERLAAQKSRASFWGRLLGDCARMRSVLAPFQRHGMWVEVGKTAFLPLGSSVLQRRRGYKDILRHHFALRAAACLPVDREIVGKQLLGMKDVAALYELWCFFAVVRELEAVLGSPARAGRPSADDTQVGVDWGLNVAWACGVEAFYNLSFSRGAAHARRSASLLLRPDIVIQVPGDSGPTMHVLDAKLRVQGDAGGDDEDEGDTVLSFKRADVTKMHAYRDALPSVRSAFILYPGDEAVRFPALEASASSTDAVGALPLVPGADAGELRDWLATLLEEAGVEPRFWKVPRAAGL